MIEKGYYIAYGFTPLPSCLLRETVINSIHANRHKKIDIKSSRETSCEIY